MGKLFASQGWWLPLYEAAISSSVDCDISRCSKDGRAHEANGHCRRSA